MQLHTIREDAPQAGEDAALYDMLEQGDILMVLAAAFRPSEEDAAFLRAQKQTGSSAHKNIAYKPTARRITGVDEQSPEDAERMRAILSRYSDATIGYIAALLPAYARDWKVDYASYRPIEEQGRELSLRHRNDLLHLDAFPTRPTNGGRILRAFTNIHPERERVWATSDDFEDLAARYAADAGLSRVTAPGSSVRRAARGAGRMLGLKMPDRSAYDEFMLGFHHYLKANSEFQANGRKHSFGFPPGATWITFTDQVAHAVVSGQYAVEQTFIVSLGAMKRPEKSPLAVLQRISGRPLVPDNAKALARR